MQPKNPSKMFLPQISPNLQKALEDEVLRLKTGVEERARQLALERVTVIPEDGMSAEEGAVALPSVQMSDLNLALDETLGKKTAAVPKISFFDLFPPFSCLCFLLCLIFGGFGMARSTSGFLDIAKIFAGALVGSTTSSGIGTIRSLRKARVS